MVQTAIKLFVTLNLILNSVCQFSSFVPQYLLDTPNQFITPANRDNQLDQYISVQNLDQDTSFALTDQNTNLDLSQFSTGSRSGCPSPGQFVNGFCICPPLFRKILNRCIPIKTITNTQTIKQTKQTPKNSTNNKIQPNNSKQQQIKQVNKNLGTAQCPLFKINLNLKKNTIEELALISRSFDGADNNLGNRNWGAAGSLLQRRAKANYADNIRTPLKNLISPRSISNSIGVQKLPIKTSNVKATVAFTIFGQFIDHDIDLTQAQRSSPQTQFMNIQIPKGDPFFKSQPVIRFTRSNFVQNNTNSGSQARRHKNMVTAWIDASQIYGSDSLTNCALRTFNKGKLKTSGKSGNQFMPLFNNFFRAGDTRAIQNSILTSFHTVFLRQHNRICDEVFKNSPNLNDETIFQIARNFVIGLIQKITMKDFLQVLLGPRYNILIGRYRGYRNNINPNIPTQFSTAGYRLGHTLLIGSIPAIDNEGNIVKQFRLNELFFRQQIINQEFVENILRGASRTLTKDKNCQFVDDVRNLLVLNPNNRQVKLDLFSLNLQRGRDHGLPTYNQARIAFGLRKINTFEQLVTNSEVQIARKLKQIYGNPDNIELIVGIICEKKFRQSVVGELGTQIIGQTFRNLRDGDRFWYEGAYPASVIQQIDNTTLADIIKRNTNAKDLSDNIFKFIDEPQ